MMKKLTEDGIGSNYYTLDPKPISFFHDERVQVEMFPSAWGEFSVQVTAPDLNYDSSLRSYKTEEEATTFARNEYTQLVTKLDNQQGLEERLMIRVLNRLERSFYRDHKIS